MDMNRRQLFRFGAAAVLTATIAPVATALSAPTLWGDGEHDDTIALQAALDGQPVTIAGERMTVVEGSIEGGRYLISAPLILKRDHVTIRRCHLIAAANFKGKVMLSVEGSHNTIDSCHLDTRAIMREPQSHTFAIRASA